MTRAFLEHTNGDEVGELILLVHNDMLIGRMPNCDIVPEPRFTSVSNVMLFCERLRMDGLSPTWVPMAKGAPTVLTSTMSA